MKKMVILLAIIAVAFIGTAQAVETVKYTVDAIDSVGSHNLITVRDDGDSVVIILNNVRLSPLGKDTEGNGLVVARTVELYSAILDSNGVKEPFIAAKVINGKAEFRIPNTAKRAGMPVVEHIWGMGNNGMMALVIDPADPWACFKLEGGNPDLNTLAIGLVMYPDGPTKPLKSLGLGKLEQGKHPELK